MFALLIIIFICAYIKTGHCFESISMVDAIRSMRCDWCCKYSPFIFPLFVGMEVDEGLEFITCLVDGRSESIEMNVGANA